MKRVAPALPEPQFSTLRDALLTSPLVGRSTLAGPFRSSRGFACIFTSAGVATVLERFPALEPWLTRALGSPGAEQLRPWWRRATRLVPNAWYLNVLLVSAGGSVARHVDATLRKPAEEPEARPVVVSVLYLEVPAAPGGALVLWRAGQRFKRVSPQVNTSVHFDGSLAHEVEPFTADGDVVRASLVIEQYHFGEQALARLPAFQLDSRAGFEAYLQHHARR